jgi:hypothetical protein
MPRILIVTLALGCLAAGNFAVLCPDVERCVVAGVTEPGLAAACAPGMGSDCCLEGKAPEGTPSREDASQARATTLVATLAQPIAPVVIAALGPGVVASRGPARVCAAIPLYTLFATLLI